MLSSTKKIQNEQLFDILMTVTLERNMITRQTIPFFSSTSWAIYGIRFNFCILSFMRWWKKIGFTNNMKNRIKHSALFNAYENGSLEKIDTLHKVNCLKMPLGK